MPETPDPAPEEDDSAGGLNEDVLAMVREQLDRDPPPSTTALYGRAAAIDSDIYQLSLRQFHAKYPLRVKRQKAREDQEETVRPGADGGPADGRGRDASGDREREAVPEDAGRRHLFGGDAPASGRTGGRPEPPGGSGGRRRAAGDGGPDAATRERLRRVFWRLAREVAEAETAAQLVGVVERMPDRVEEVARIVSGRGGGS